MDAKLKKEGWIENNGVRPFNDGTIVDAMFNDGTVALSRYCGGSNHYKFAGTDLKKSGNSMWKPNTYRLENAVAAVKYYRVPWKRHRGGKCPVKVGETVEFRVRSGEVVTSKINVALSKNYVWEHIKDNTDIMAYRVIRGIGC